MVEAVAVLGEVDRGRDVVERDHLVQQLEEPGTVEPGDLAENCQGELLADDRRPVEHVTGVVGDVGQAPLHGLLHPLGDELVQPTLEVDRVVPVREPQDHLLEEQRVAERPLVELGHEAVGDVLAGEAGGLLHVAADVGLVEPL